MRLSRKSVFAYGERKGKKNPLPGSCYVRLRKGRVGVGADGYSPRKCDGSSRLSRCFRRRPTVKKGNSTQYSVSHTQNKTLERGITISH